MNKSNKGFTLVELLVVIGILGILMSALFPAVSGAMLSAKTAACAADGRNIIMGIITANTDCENSGMGSLWPVTTAQEGANENSDDSEDVRKGGYTTTYEYFSRLFKMKTYGDDNWEPDVDKSLLSKLYGQGVPGPSSKELKNTNVKWIIGANVDNVPGNMPILFTRNVAIGPIETITEYDGQSTTTPKIDLGTKNSADYDIPFAGDAVVVVRKDGGAQVIKKRQCNPKVFFQQGFKLTSSGDNQFKYLTAK